MLPERHAHASLLEGKSLPGPHPCCYDTQVQARGPPSEDDPTIAGHLLRLRDHKGQPLSNDRLHAEFSIMFIGGETGILHTTAQLYCMKR